MDARLRISPAANPSDFLVQLWDAGFPAAGAPPLAAGTFALASLDAVAPSRDEILDKVRTQTNPDAVFREAGSKLFALLEQAGVAQAWLGLPQQSFCTYLELDSGVEELPWELISRDAGGGASTRYFTRIQAPIVRLHADAGKALAMDPMLRVLLVTGQPVSAVTAFPGNHVAAIRRRFASCECNVHLEVMEQPGLPELATRLDELRPHIFFFIGHGAPNPQTGLPALVFGLREADPIWWDSDDIYNQFTNQSWAPRLVVLNACESAKGTSTSMAAVSSAFARGGALAVVGNQATVTDVHALELSSKLCKYLVEGVRIDVALAQIRNALGQMPDGWSRRDWALPVLSVAVSPQDLLAFPAIPALVRNCTVLGEFQRAQGPNPFIDRIDPRRNITASLHPFAPGRPARHCVIVEGGEGTGKSWLVKRCERDLASAGMWVRHCELSGVPGLDFIGVLERILSGDPTKPHSLIHAALPAVHFAEFIARAAEYRGGLKDQGSIRRVCEAFRAGLDATSVTQGLLIVLDQFRREGGGGIAAEEFQLGLLNDFVIPLANGACPRVHLVLIARSGESARYGLDQVINARKFNVEPFEANEFPTLFLEFCRFEHNQDLHLVEQFCSRFFIKNAAWLPTKLQEMKGYVEESLR
jgi:CHAT domain